MKSTVAPGLRTMPFKVSVFPDTVSEITEAPALSVTPVMTCVVPPVLVKVKRAAVDAKAVPAPPFSKPLAVPPPKLIVEPALTVVGPVYRFAPVKVRVPGPLAVSPKPLPEITPPTVNVLANSVTVRRAPKATAPYPSSWSYCR